VKAIVVNDLWPNISQIFPIFLKVFFKAAVHQNSIGWQEFSNFTCQFASLKNTLAFSAGMNEALKTPRLTFKEGVAAFTDEALMSCGLK